MSSTKSYKIAVCASASLYKELIELSNQIESSDFSLLLPDMAQRMKDGQADGDEANIDWAQEGYDYKADLIRGHFKEIEDSDAILVTNFTKDGKENYIGGNVLMEMTVAFYLQKPIVILGSAPMYSPLIDEIMGMQPTFLNGDIEALSEVVSNL